MTTARVPTATTERGDHPVWWRPTSWTPFGRRLAVIGLGALAWNLIYVQFELPYRLFTDEAWYVEQAHLLFTAHPWSNIFTHAQPSAQHGPLTSLLVAPFAWLFPHSFASLRNVMAVLGAVTVLVLGRVGQAIGGNRVGLLAAGVAAIFPDLWIRDGLVVAEPVAILLVAVAVWITVRSSGGATLRRTAAMGVLGGLVLLARPEEVVVIVVMALVVIFRRPTTRRSLHVGVLVVALCVPVAPWSIYNEGRFHGTVLISNDLGITLAGANCHRTYYDLAIMGYDSEPCWRAAQNRAAAKSPDEAVQSSLMRQQAQRFILHHLSRVPLVVAMREVWFVGFYRPGWVVFTSQKNDQPSWATWAQVYAFYAAFVAAMAAWWRRRRERWPHWLLGLLVAYSFVVAGLFVGHWRYRISLDVGLVLLLALAGDAWLRQREAAGGGAESLSPTPG